MLGINPYLNLNLNTPYYNINSSVINFNLSTYYQLSTSITDLANISNFYQYFNTSPTLTSGLIQNMLPNLFGNNFGIIPQNNPLSISLLTQNNYPINNQLFLILLMLLLTLVLQNNTQTPFGNPYNFGNIPTPGIGGMPGIGIMPSNIPGIGTFPGNIPNIYNSPINYPSNISTDSSSNAGGSVVNIALQQVGKPYVFGATGPNAFDCSGLVQWAFKKVGVNLPRTADMQFRVGRPVSKDQLQPGDLVFFANTYKPGISHVGIYIGGGKFVHAANEKQGVIVSSLSESYWAQHYAGARRV
ncbi:MAG: C40 family peptidase [bacterium]